MTGPFTRDLRRRQVCDWLTRCGIDPMRVPEHTPLVLHCADDGVATVDYELCVLDDDGSVKVDWERKEVVTEAFTKRVNHLPPGYDPRMGDSFDVAEWVFGSETCQHEEDA